MAGVGRYMKFIAQPGRGDELAQLLLRAADSLQDTPGCELYVINRSPTDPDVVWVTELWLSQDALEASLEQLRAGDAQAQVAELRALLAAPPERIDVEPLGGVGYLPGGAGYTHVNLTDDVEDVAPRFGFGEQGEARFANRALGTVGTGVSHQRLRPNIRQAFGHRHQHAEEVVVVLAGSGRVKIDDDVREVRPLDAIRLAPSSARGFEAGPDGLELLVFSAKRPGDAVMDPAFWPAEASAGG
ncbi:MAG TPA: antibiotic biosynthesis monooxygenase [Solirubrobacteraceae bacterium]|nr:antibiotic biosynthesis monooxygenase [Solirubrobacteraceae bacterium]